MHEAAKDLRFEEAARLRDEITELKRELPRRGLIAQSAPPNIRSTGGSPRVP